MSEIAKRELTSIDNRIAYAEYMLNLIDNEPNTLTDTGNRLPIPISSQKQKWKAALKMLKKERRKLEKMYKERGWLDE